MELQLPQQTYQSRSKPFSSERLLNMIMEKSGTGTNAYFLIGTPGLKEYYDFGGQEQALGMIYLRSFLILATNAGIYVLYKSTIDNNVRVIKRKTWSDFGFRSTNEPTQMVSNGDSVMLLASGKLIYVTLNGENELDPDSWYMAAATVPNENARYTSVSYISGVFAASCQIDRTSYMHFTDVLDTEMKYVVQLDTALVNLSALKSNMRELWVFGANSTEVLAPTGEAGDDFFAHVAGAYANKGCVCKNSIATHETAFIFYASDGNIYFAQNYASMTVISTPAIVDMIRSWGSLDTETERNNVIGQVYTQDGHTFYVLKFKKFGKTLMYDMTVGSWIERETGNGEEWEGEYIVRKPNGEMIVSSKSDSKLYTMDSRVFTDNGTPICREFVFATIKSTDKKRMFFSSLTLDMDAGLGPNDSVMLSWSDDGGYTWRPERMIKLGDYGDFTKKIQFRRLGSSTVRTFKVRLSTQGLVNVLGANVEFEEGQK